MSLRSVPETLKASGNSTSGSFTVVSAVANQRVYIYRFIITIGTPGVTVTFEDSNDNNLSQDFQMAANGAIVTDYSINGDPWYYTAAGAGFVIEQSGTTNIGYDVYYLQGP